MSRLNRRRMLATVGSALTVGLAGCGGGTDDETTDAGDESPMESPMETPMETESMGGDMDTAGVRVAHMSPDVPDVDVYVDGSRVLETVPFRDVGPYLDVPTGARQITVTEAGNESNAVFDQELMLEATDYTLVASGELGEETFEVLVLGDDNSDPGGNMTRVRAVHVSPDAGAVDITVNAGPTLFDDVPFKASAYTTVEANDYTAQVRPATDADDGEVVYDTDVSLNGGTVYTVFASGYLTPDDEPTDESFELTVAQDASY